MTTERDTRFHAHPIDSEIDWSVLDAFAAFRKPGGEDPRARLITVFLNASPPLMKDLRSALASGDAQALGRTAHSLKSSSRGMGAQGLGSICAELEKMGRENTLQDTPPLLDKAEKEFAAVCDAFRDKLLECGE